MRDRGLFFENDITLISAFVNNHSLASSFYTIKSDIYLRESESKNSLDSGDLLGTQKAASQAANSGEGGRRSASFDDIEQVGSSMAIVILQEDRRNFL